MKRHLLGLIAPLALAGCAQPAATAPSPQISRGTPPPRLISKDEPVIRAVVDSFFEKSTWNTDWNKGKTLVTIDKWGVSERPDFEDIVTAEVAEAMKREEAENLRVLAVFKAATGNIPVPPVAPLQRLQLGSRSFLADGATDDFRKTYGSGAAFTTNGKKTTARGPVWFPAPPAYSGNGQKAVVKASAPWSMHHATMTFFLSRKQGEWKIDCVRQAIYP